MPERPATLASLLAHARAALAAAGINDAPLDARLLVEHFSGTSRTDAITTPDRAVSKATLATVDAALKRRIGGEPAHRILGFREFYGLRLRLSEETLEPRPDTETLVDALLPLLRKIVAREGSCRILDLGTGTGAIALALLANIDGAVATGVDLSADALATARKNAGELGLGSRFTALQSDWFSGVSGDFHAIAANPPYIPSDDLATLQGEVRDFDPAKALDGGPDGLDAYRTIAAQSGSCLAPDGIVAVEIGAGQKQDVMKLFIEAGYRLAETRRDLSGHERVLVFERP